MENMVCAVLDGFMLYGLGDQAGEIGAIDYSTPTMGDPLIQDMGEDPDPWDAGVEDWAADTDTFDAFVQDYPGDPNPWDAVVEEF